MTAAWRREKRDKTMLFELGQHGTQSHDSALTRRGAVERTIKGLKYQRVTLGLRLIPKRQKEKGIRAKVKRTL